MKTIKAFLIGIFTLVLSIASLVYATTLAVDSTTLYYKYNQPEPISFTATFILASVIVFAIALQLLMISLSSFKVFIKYHNLYLNNKRDRQVQDQVIDESYKQLYKDLSDAPTIELKEAIIKDFYKQEEKEPRNLIGLIEQMKMRAK